jgi:hypothetical protein
MVHPGGENRGEENLRRLRNCLRRRERWGNFQVFLLILLSLPGTLIDSFVLSGILWLMGPFQHHISWLYVFFPCIPVSILLFWWIDRETPAPDWDSLARGAGSGLTTGGGHLELSPWTPGVGYGAREGMPILTEILVMGPRILRKAIRKFRGIQAVSGADRNRASQILQSLLAVDHGLDVKNLLQPHEPLSSLTPALAYLLFHQWIDSSHDARHVWLSGESRAIIQRAI